MIATQDGAMSDISRQNWKQYTLIDNDIFSKRNTISRQFYRNYTAKTEFHLITLCFFDEI
ncbi:hypothetical protein AERO9A_350006 [Aeromonas salmonicida]|nr:hypothetical protein AERO9A_350006 [Aeromonas salmonicida]